MLLHFRDEAAAALRLARVLGLPAAEIESHRFPDGELRLRLPLCQPGDRLPDDVLLFRGLVQPNDKLVELLIVARAARGHGARRLGLVAPYLAYMRQDMEFNPGEAVSQRIVGAFLADLFDAVVTVDPHLHRITQLSEAIPRIPAIALSAAPALGAHVARERPGALLVGPDEESAQWVGRAARQQGLAHAVCRKVRRGDRDVQVALPATLRPSALHDRPVVLMDDMASTGHTMAEAARLLLAAGARSVDVAVTHAMLTPDAPALLRSAGVGQVWSSDSVQHASNVVQLAELMGTAVRGLQWKWGAEHAAVG